MKKPDILVFFCDQLRIDLLGCHGGSLVRTPNIDALAADAVRFENAYTPVAICSPARASLMTGVYPHSHHMFNNSSPKYSYCEHLKSDMTMIQDWADDETDYQTAYFGKWHIGPAQDLFDSRFHRTQKPLAGGPPFLSSSHWHPGPSLGPIRYDAGGGKSGTLDLPMASFPDVVAAQYTIDFMNDRDSGRPSLTFCAFPGPHGPWFVPDEYGIRYDPNDIPLWPNIHDTLEGKPINQKKLKILDNNPGSIGHMPGGEEELKRHLACCFSYLELVDEMVGCVTTELKKRGTYDDTLIVFTADHGDMAGSHGFKSKGAYMYDEIYRIPLIIKPAGASAARVVSEPVNLIDVTATLMHAMSGRQHTSLGGQALHGSSLLPFASGESPPWREVNYSEYHGDWYGHYSARMVTDGKWKLVWNLSDLCELYDIENDPHELTNLFYEVKHREVVERYFELLLGEARRTDDAHVRLLKYETEIGFSSTKTIA